MEILFMLGGILSIVGVILLFAFLITAFVCSRKVETILAPYAQYGVFSKISAYMTLSAVGAGIVMTICGIGLFFLGNAIENNIIYALVSLGLGILFLYLAIVTYRRALKKCPDFLKKKCIKSMLAVALGVSVKPALLFVKFSFENAGGFTGGNAGFNRAYYSRANGQEYLLQEVVNGQGVLRSNNGQVVHVIPNGDGTVHDTSGNIYDPA